jgi:hypothetical protein
VPSYDDRVTAVLTGTLDNDDQTADEEPNDPEELLEEVEPELLVESNNP